MTACTEEGCDKPAGTPAETERLLSSAQARPMAQEPTIRCEAARAQAHAQLAAALVLIEDADPGVLIPLPART